MKILMVAVACFCLASCAHRGELKTPSQIEAQKAKADARAAKEAAKKPPTTEAQ